MPKLHSDSFFLELSPAEKDSLLEVLHEILNAPLDESLGDILQRTESNTANITSIYHSLY